MQPRSSNLLKVIQAANIWVELFYSWDRLMRANNSPRSCRFRAPHHHDWRERIRVREIHQMNCFDDAVCLSRMPFWGVAFLPRNDSWPSGFHLRLSASMGQKKFEYFLVRRLGLIGKKQVTRVLEQDESCAGNPRCDQFPVSGRYQRI